ncbi:hypothetical protein N7456_007449 [Penicillium angulare]|uniref:Zn(2)-C6 fungal-type domain-containing protein n=1 Tax=Penicillium angulare TaxID=116970 RepID=A0A9W9FAR8_9EURO|nr:hypothetical protein N7456_007449 [Penicillium angulare]
MSRPLKQREIACARCFRLKRKCDHAKPTCGECRRKGAECLPARSRRTGDSITVPLAYLKELEKRVAELEGHSRNNGTNVELRDVGVQTDSIDELDTPPDNMCMLWDPREKSPPWKQDWVPEVSFLASQGRISRPPSQVSFTDTFTLSDETLNFLRLDKSSVSPLIGDDSPWLTELYTNIYFTITHREWPFLNEATWKSWQSESISEGREEWRTFFIRMVYAIGASLCSTMHRDPAHSTRSRELYMSAMSYYPHVVGHSSMVLQVQASLLLIVYSLHSPSSEEIVTSVSSIVPFCTAAMTEIRKSARATRDGEVTAASGEVLTENMFIACYMLNVIIASGWDRPLSDAYQAVEDDMCTLGDIIQPPPNINPALAHLFRLRKIQTNIRRSVERARWQISEEKDALNSSFKAALDVWRQEIPRYGTPTVSCGYYHPNWMTKLYDYSILMLLEDKHNFLDHEGTEEIFSAVVQVCLKYRRLQEEGHVMCFTWSALVYQFRAGIMLLYLIWATRPITDSVEIQPQSPTYHSPEAIEACTKNLACFAERWADAVPYLKMFEFLQQKTLWDLDITSETHVVTLAEAEAYLEQLKESYLHRAILGMVEDMMYGDFARFETLPSEFMTGIL